MEVGGRVRQTPEDKKIPVFIGLMNEHTLHYGQESCTYCHISGAQLTIQSTMKKRLRKTISDSESKNNLAEGDWKKIKAHPFTRGEKQRAATDHLKWHSIDAALHTCTSFYSDGSTFIHVER